MVEQIQIWQIKKISVLFFANGWKRKKEGDALTHAVYGKGLTVLMSSRTFLLQKASLNTTLLKALHINPYRYWCVITGVCLCLSLYIHSCRKHEKCELVGFTWFHLHKLDIKSETNQCFHVFTELHWKKWTLWCSNLIILWK